jgi:hypothetical protein
MKVGCNFCKTITMILSYIPLRKNFLHLSVFLFFVFIILCACSLRVTPSQLWQARLVECCGAIVSLFLFSLFIVSVLTKPAFVTQNRVRNRNLVAGVFSWMCQRFSQYDVNHRNTAFVIIITVPLLTFLYSWLWWHQMQSYSIQTTTAPLVYSTPSHSYPLQ